MKHLCMGLLIVGTAFCLLACKSATKDTTDTKDTKDAKNTKNTEAAAASTSSPSKAQPAAPPPPSPYLAKLSWKEGDSFDFGEINDGDIVEHTYPFINTGQSPLLITHVAAACGCTVPTWPKDPIAIGEEGEIVVKFNSKGRKGVQNKRITITANINQSTTTLSLRGIVK